MGVVAQVATALPQVVLAQEAPSLKLSLGVADTVLLFVYFVFVIGIGFALKRAVSTSTDFFLGGRSLPAWVTGLAFVSANLGAIEILGQAASGAQYGAAIVHYYWIGAVPAMVFLGIVMMPFYYGSKVRSVPEYLRLRYDQKAHLINAVTFVLSSVLIAGVNLFALATVIDALLGIALPVAVLLSAGFVLSYILLGGLRSAIYNEVLQFFVILAGLIPLVVVALKEVGGIGSLFDRLRETEGGAFTSAWAGTGFGGNNPLGDWFGIVMGLGFCLSFGYWTTNFAEVQRAMSAKDDNAARMTPIIAAYPKALIPLLTVLPGMMAVVLIPNLGGDPGDIAYNNAIPALMQKYLPPGVLGVAVTGLVAAFMAGNGRRAIPRRERLEARAAHGVRAGHGPCRAAGLHGRSAVRQRARQAFRLQPDPRGPVRREPHRPRRDPLHPEFEVFQNNAGGQQGTGIPGLRSVARLMLDHWGLFGWAIAAMELTGGALLALGLLTRLAALVGLGQQLFLPLVYASSDRWALEQPHEYVPLIILALVPAGRVEVGLCAEDLARALDGGSYAEQVRADQSEAGRREVTGVPTFLVDDRHVVPGALSPDSLLAALRRAWSARLGRGGDAGERW